MGTPKEIDWLRTHVIDDWEFVGNTKKSREKMKYIIEENSRIMINWAEWQNQMSSYVCY